MIKKAALAYLELGFNVIPIGANKKPLVKWAYYQENRVEPHEIDSWWMEWPKANIAILTGEMSNLVVFDLDTDRARQHCKKHGVPRTPIAHTAKGLHIYMGYPATFKGMKALIGNRSNPDLGLDVRGQGGYVVAPPSVHESGITYRWGKFHPWNTPKGIMLPWMMEYSMAPQDNGQRERGWQQQVLLGVKTGGRNQAAASLAGRYLNKDLSVEEITEILLMWNKRNLPPLSADEIITTVASIGGRHKGRGT